MKRTVKLIEVQTPKGEAFFQLRIIESVLPEEEGQPKSQSASGGNGAKPQNGDGKSPSSAGDPMTDSQKRYLFRLMAMRGKEGDAAHDELKRLFKVASLKDVTKIEASMLIEELLEKEKQGNGGGDGTSF